MSVVNVQPHNVVAVNQLQLGVQTSYGNWVQLVNEPVYGQLLKDANVKLIRFFDMMDSRENLAPCISWDELTRTGMWNWANIDRFVGKIFEIGAEPMICLGFAGSPTDPATLPPGMVVNGTTGLPNPDSFAAYAREWVRHFKQAGLPVRFYEIFNEPDAYFGWTPDATKFGYFTALFKATYQQMKLENADVIIGNDFCMRKPVLDSWLADNVELGSLNFHKYDGFGIIDPSDPNYRTDQQVFGYGESRYFASDPLGRSVVASQQEYYSKRNRVLPTINSECNFNAHWRTGTDIRNENICGAVWLALVLRMSILNGLSYHVYFTLAGSYSWEKTSKPMDGAGFGFINSDNKKPWAPYYVYRMIGPNVSINDKVLLTDVADTRLRVIAWLHESNMNILLINRSHDQIHVQLVGTPVSMASLKVNESIPFENMSLIEETVNTNDILLSGYTVQLLQAPVATARYLFKQWQDGDTNPTKTIIA